MPSLCLLPRSLKHRVGLAHARTHPEKDLQPPTPRLRFIRLDRGEQCVGIRDGRVSLTTAILAESGIASGYFAASSATFSFRTFTRGSPRKPNCGCFSVFAR